MTASRPVALLVGAGDAIGAAVARRFAAGGLQVCVARRDAAKAKALIDEVAADGGNAAGLQRRCPPGGRGRGPVRQDRARGRAHRSLPLQRRLERQHAAAGDDRDAVPQVLGARLLWRLPHRPRGGAPHGAARPRHHPVHRRHRQRARRRGLCRLRLGKIRPAGRGAIDGARAGAEEHPCRPSPDRRRRGQRGHPQAHAGAHRR